MAWKKPAGKKKPAQQQTPKKNNEANATFPGLKAPGQTPPAKTHYQEVQESEVMVLQAIYGEDFTQHEAAHGAWQVRSILSLLLPQCCPLTDVQKSEPRFDIKIKPSSDQELSVTLGVVMVATYPKTPPLLTIKDDHSLRESTKFKIQKFVETQPKIYAQAEQEMIDQIVEGIRDILEEAAQKKVQGLEIPSLEEERAAHEAELARLAQSEKEREERKKLEESKEEERVLEDMLQEELKRQRNKAKESRKKNRSHQLSPDRAPQDPGETDETLMFDQPCKITDGSGNALFFQTVIGKTVFREGPITTVYKVKPVLSARTVRPSLALKQVEVKSHGKDSAQFKKQLQYLESQMETLKKLRHQNLLPFLDFRIDRGISDTDSSAPTIWTVSILTPLATKGPIEELLDLAGHIDTNKAKIWTADLLEALAFLHNNGIIHQDLHPANILLYRNEAGDIVPKITDSFYQRELHNLCTKIKTLTSSKAAKSAYWFPPEIAGVTKPQYTQKTDVWDFGIVFLQMIFGLDVVEKYHSPSALMDSLSLSAPLEELVSKFFKSDPKKRPRAFELSSSEFLATNAPIIDDEDIAVPGSLMPMPQMTPQRMRHDSMSRGPMSSRYRQDYVEEARLGKGGFGEVVRARKMIDGHLYAIKKITQRSQETLSEILKEVRLLSQMNHPAVVRYYNTWLEEVPDYADTEGDTSTEGGATDVTDNSQMTISHGINIEFAESKSRGLDFMSSSGHPGIEYDYSSSEEEDDDEDEDDEEDESDSDSNDDAATVSGKNHLGVTGRRPRRGSTRPYKTVMYISMEYCEKRVGSHYAKTETRMIVLTNL